MRQLAEETIGLSKGGIALKRFHDLEGDLVVDLGDGNRERLREFFIGRGTADYRV